MVEAEGVPEPPAVWFSYSVDRKGEHPQRHLSGYRGVLQADAYGAYDELYVIEAENRGLSSAGRLAARKSRTVLLMQSLQTGSWSR